MTQIQKTVGIEVRLSHIAATPPGLRVTVHVVLVKVEGEKLTFSFDANDGVDKISPGTQKQYIINAARLNEKMTMKMKAASSSTCGRE